MKNVFCKIGVAIVAIIVIALLLLANFATDKMIARVDEAYKTAASEKRVVKTFALWAVRWWVGGGRK